MIIRFVARIQAHGMEVHFIEVVPGMNPRSQIDRLAPTGPSIAASTEWKQPLIMNHAIIALCLAKMLSGHEIASLGTRRLVRIGRRGGIGRARDSS
jgi:hypothetical protein